MKNVIIALEKIEKTLKVSNDVTTIRKAVQEAMDAVRVAIKEANEAQKADLVQLESELAVWQTKVSAIVKETIGRQGMAKHSHHWIEKLQTKGLNV